jgi:D-alanyl-D-alanine carboxypeptidase/D-alanyl-D-alanine-endopeptidase (penicillin-binding protein 4)
LGVWFILAGGIRPADAGVPSALSKKINKLLSVPAMKGVEIGILVARPEDGTEIFSLNPDKSLMPASNMKLLTTACALVRLNPEYRFKTIIYGDAPIRQGKVKGNLYLKGFGDPFLVNEEMWRMISNLHGIGLREITGDLIADDSFFDAERWRKGWGNHRTSRWYHAEISALSFNFNTIAFHLLAATRPGLPPLVWTAPPQSSYIRLENLAQTVKKRKKKINVERINTKDKDTFRITGTLAVDSKFKTFYRTIRDATRYSGVSFVDFLKRENITFNGKVKSGKVPSPAVPIYTWKSKSLGNIISGLNQFSNNFIAECILKTMGAEILDPPGTAEKGLEVLRKFLVETGINTKSLVLDDGSGLSRQNRLSARSLVQVLSYMYGRFEYRPEYIASLATYGVNGTLKKRNGAPIRFVRAKTGRINGVLALSGYIGKGKEMLAFSMLMNNIRKDKQKVEKIQDAICRAIWEESSIFHPPSRHKTTSQSQRE